MIVFYFSKTRICFDFSFFAAVALFILFFSRNCSIDAVISCVLHELAHLVVMRLFAVYPEEITFYGAGIRISSSGVKYCNMLQKFFIYFAGCGANLIFAVIMVLFSQETLACVNILIAVFNLLPFGELDGSALLSIILIRFVRPERIDIYRQIAEIAGISILFIALSFYFNSVNPFSFFVPLYFFIVSRLISR